MKQDNIARILTKDNPPSFLCDQDLTLLAVMRNTSQPAGSGLVPGTPLASLSPSGKDEIILAKESLRKGAPYFSIKFEFLTQNSTLGMFPFFQNDQLVLVLCCIFADGELPPSQPAACPPFLSVPLEAVSDCYRAPAMDVFNLLATQATRMQASEDYQGLEYLNAAGRRCQDVLRHASAQNDYAMLETGRVSLNMSKHLLNRFLEDLYGTVRVLLGAAQYRLVYEPCEELVITDFDENLLTKAVLQLLSNAFRFSPADSTVTLGLSIQGSAAAITVSDDGSGIPQEEIPRIFDPFYYIASSVPSGEDHGLGLGLTIARQIAGLHHGQIYVSSRENGGTRVALTLPVIDKPSAELTLHSNNTKYITDRFSDLYLMLSGICKLNFF